MACEGTGSRRRVSSGQEITCSRCKGTGKAACNPRCDSCLGAGQITQDQQKEQVSKYSPPRLVPALPYKVHVTLVLIGAFVVNYAIMALLFGSRTLLAPSITALDDMGAMIPMLFVHGEYWRILTSAFLHIGLAHLVFNTVALLQAGQILERQVGSARFLVVFVLSVLGGGLADLFLQDPRVCVAGASGGLCGLVGFGIVYAWQMRDTPQRTFFSQWAAYTVVFSVLVGADHYAHGGGFVVGALLGLVFARLEPSATPGGTERARFLDRFVWPTLATICAGLCVLALAFMFMHLPRNPDRGHARELFEGGRYHEALEPLNQMVTDHPTDREAQLMRAQALEYVGDSDRAIDAYTACIQQAPDNPRLRMKRAILLAAARRPDLAQADLEILEKTGEVNQPEYLLLLAQFNMARGKWDEARADFERLLEQDLGQPEPVEAALAACEYHLGRSVDALKRLDRIVASASDARFRDERAWMHFYLGHYKEAMDDAGVYLARRGYGADASSYLFLVRYFAAHFQEKDVEAARWLQQALQQCPRTWPFPIVRYLARQIDASTLLAQATTKDRLTEARTWVGLDLEVSKRILQAREHFAWVREHGNRMYNETEIATVRLRALAAQAQQAASAPGTGSPAPLAAPPPVATGSPAVLPAP